MNDMNGVCPTCHAWVNPEASTLHAKWHDHNDRAYEVLSELVLDLRAELRGEAR